MVIPDGVTRINSRAFYGCENLHSIDRIIIESPFLGSITVHADVNSINASSFNNCISLSCFDVSGENEVYISVDGILFSKDLSRLIRSPLASPVKEYTVLETVIAIGPSAFNSTHDLL